MSKEQIITEALQEAGILKKTRQGYLRLWSMKKINRIKKAIRYALELMEKKK